MATDQPSSTGPVPGPSRQRRQSQSTLAAVDRRRSRMSPTRIVLALLKHGKYVAAGAAGIWWLDLRAAAENVLDGEDGWAKRMLKAHIGLQGLTIVFFLYLTLFLPWVRGYIPNYPKWQASRRLRVIVPALTTSILLGWTLLVCALSHAANPVPGGPIRDAIRDALNVENVKPGLGVMGAMAGATAVYTLVFGLLGFIPAPNVPVRIKKRQ